MSTANRRLAFATLSVIALLALFAGYYVFGNRKSPAASMMVEPPLGEMDIPFDEYVFDADSGFTLLRHTGTRVAFLSGDLVTKNGETVKGKVTLRVREFHTADDLFRAGIPMSTDAGRSAFLQSAGMIELHAYQGGAELNIRSGRSVPVELAGYRPAEGYSLYRFEPGKEWKVLDTFITGINIRKAEGLRRADSLPEKPEDPSEDLVVDLVSNLSEAPYLKPFQDRQWRIAKKDRSPEVEAAMRVQWDKVDIIADNRRKMRYRLVFSRKVHFSYDSSATRSCTVYATPVYAGSRRNAKKDFEESLAAYEDILKKMEVEKARLQQEADLLNNFKVQQLGIWNIDRILKESGQLITRVAFDFEQQLDRDINKIRLFALYDDDNAVLSYQPDEWDKVRISPDRRMRLIAVLPGNQLALASFEEIKARLAENKTELRLSTRRLSHTEYLRALAGSGIVGR